MILVVSISIFPKIEKYLFEKSYRFEWNHSWNHCRNASRIRRKIHTVILSKANFQRLIPYLVVVLLILAVRGGVTVRGGGGGGSLWRWQVDRSVSVCVMIHYAIVLKSRSSLRQSVCWLPLVHWTWTPLLNSDSRYYVTPRNFSTGKRIRRHRSRKRCFSLAKRVSL